MDACCCSASSSASTSGALGLFLLPRGRPRFFGSGAAFSLSISDRRLSISALSLSSWALSITTSTFRPSRWPFSRLIRSFPLANADIRDAEHLPLVDQIAICVAGIEAQELFNCPIHQHAALGDYLKVRELVAGLTDAESHEYRQAGYLRALDILKGRLPEIETLAHQLFHQRRIAA
jgi:hypothetical protein